MLVRRRNRPQREGRRPAVPPPVAVRPIHGAVVRCHALPETSGQRASRTLGAHWGLRPEVRWWDSCMIRVGCAALWRIGAVFPVGAEIAGHSHRGREAVLPDNGVIQLVVLVQGGSFPSITLNADSGRMNPMWNSLRADEESGRPGTHCRRHWALRLLGRFRPAPDRGACGGHGRPRRGASPALEDREGLGCRWSPRTGPVGFTAARA